MANPDVAPSALRRIQQEFASFCDGHGKASEADTRAKVIDKILTEVCLWPEGAISREDRVQRGLIDYTLKVQSRP